MNDAATTLSPLRVRLIVFAAMLAVAIASIYLIDRRAIQQQARMNAPAVQAVD